MRSPSDHDRQTIVEMLRRFRAAQETLLQSGGGSGNPVRMPLTWTVEMRELERCLGLLARRRPRLHRMVMARYVDPTVTRRTLHGKVRRQVGGDEIVWIDLGPCSEVRAYVKLPEHRTAAEYSCVVASWPGWVLKGQVELAVGLLVGWFESSSAVGPALPVEMVAA